MSLPTGNPAISYMPIYNIAFYGALAFLGGTLFAGLNLTAVWAVLLFAAATVIFAAREKHEWGVAFFLIFLFVFGIFYYNFFFSLKKSGQIITFDEEISFSGLVSKEPQLSEKFQKITLELNPPLRGEISILASPSPEINYGDAIQATGEVTNSASVRQGPISFFPDIKVVSANNGSWLKERLIGFKQNIILQFKQFLPGDSAALLSGLTLGWRGDFTDEFKKEMSLSGTTHMVALSGYNITILVLVVAGIFGYWLSRRLTFWLTSFTILMFILMVGAEASVVRAAIMGFLALLAKHAGRRYSMRNAIVLTAALMVFADPGTLFDVGFELSFLSLIGIVYLEPAITKFLRIEEHGKSFISWRENAITTVSAQLAVAPILIAVFGNFSLTSIVANVLILEFVPLTMFFGFLLAVSGWIFYYSGFIVALLENILLKYELGVIKLFANLSMPIFSEAHSWILFAFYYLVLITFAFYGNKTTKSKLV